MSSSSSSSNSPCAACKIQRRKCTQECVFAPYFPPDNPQRFSYVHKVFGASNVAKLLNELNAAQREDAVKSLAYEAEARLRDPVYGCVGLISILQHKLKHLQTELNHAKKQLATYVAVPPTPSALNPAPSNAFSLFPSHETPFFRFNEEAAVANYPSSSSFPTSCNSLLSPCHSFQQVDHSFRHALLHPDLKFSQMHQKPETGHATNTAPSC